MILSILVTAAMLHQPAVSRTHVAFVYDNQVWTARRDGTQPTKLTTSAERKSEPRFSPDGTMVAFSATDSTTASNLYTLPLRGGTPRRVTWLPSHQTLCQWTRTDGLLFYTNGLSFTRLEMQLFTVSPTGALPRKLPLAYGADGAIDDSGEWLAYTPQWPNNLTAHWKRYRGGAASDVHLVNLRTRESIKVTDASGVEFRPMWSGRTLFYTSDAGTGQRLNLWSYDPQTRKRTQLTHFTEYDVRNPSSGGGAIVFQLGPELRLYDVASGRITTLRIDIPQRAAAKRDIDMSRFITARQLAAGGRALLLEARGDLWLGGRNLTATSGAFEREASLSPDGTRVAYWSDATGEYQLYVDGKPLTKFTSGFRYRPVWSPDATKLAFADYAGAIFIVDIATGALESIDQDPWSELPELAWSPDSQSLVYTRTEPNRLTTLRMSTVKDGRRESRQLTSAMFAATTPVFARDHLFFISYRNFATPVPDWLQQRIAHRSITVVMAMPLATLDERHAIRLGAATGAITSLAATDAGDAVYGFTDPNGTQSIRLFDMRAQKEQTLVEGTSDFNVSNAGQHLLIVRNGAYSVRTFGDAAESPLATANMTTTVDLRAEWQQLFTDAWRFYRDFFHAPKVAGTFDWNDVRRRYAAMLAHADTREDVNWVLAEMIGEVGVGHAYIANGGDVRRAPAGETIGMLGADYELANGAYRFTRIYQSAAWDDRVRSPLRDVRTGETLLAVNGVAIDTTRDPRAAFVGLANKPVTLRIGNEHGAREITVTPVASESELRDRDWVERNRAYVERASGGRVGYVRITDFGTNGVNEVARQFYGQVDKEALIFDPRWAIGGWTGHLLAELLGRRQLNSAASRYSEHAWPVPRWGAHFGRKAVLVNRYVVSAGENFAFYFRKLALGPLVGERTWGGLTGLNPVPSLIDGGVVNVPNAPFFDDSGWLIEGHGIEPDITVEDDAAKRSELEPDAQLVAAVKALRD